MTISVKELQILKTTSRVASGFSLVGASFVILTFCTSAEFHRPINRLAFFASVGNIMTNVATIASRDGIDAGRTSHICQAQAFIIQWAIPADALLCLFMALNVYLTVFKKKTTKQLKCLEPYYIVFGYGIPLVPAIVLLFTKSEERGTAYGPALLWCWISDEWQFLRLAAFYGPVWIILGITFIIYLLAGRLIFQLRSNLRQFAKGTPPRVLPRPTSLPPNPIGPIVPGKIAVTTVDTVEMSTITESRLSENESFARSGIFRSNTIKTAARVPSIAGDPTLTYPSPAFVFTGMKPGSLKTMDTLPQIGEMSSYSCVIEATTSRENTGVANRPRRNTALEANTAAWAYSRCAMLFFVALIITWLPSSINRLYHFGDPENISFGLNFVAAMVLPAQGFWNGLIYIVTTFPACKKYVRDVGYSLHRPCQWFSRFLSWNALSPRQKDREKETILGSSIC